MDEAVDDWHRTVGYEPSQESAGPPLTYSR
jgi:hypothetical protein